MDITKKVVMAVYPPDPSLPARIYNGVDARVGRPIVSSEAITRPMRKVKRPWWKKLLGL